MKCNLKSYFIKNNLLENNSIFEKMINLIDLYNIPFLLDKQNSILEKFIFDVAHFHLKNFDTDLRDVYIEFELKNNINFDINCDNYDKIVNKCIDRIPLFTTIVYLDENLSIITDMNNETYKYKNFSDLYVVLHKKMNNIVFNGGYYYSDGVNIENIHKHLVINVWKVKPYNVPYFNFDQFLFKCLMHEKKEIKPFYFKIDDQIFEFEPLNKIMKIDVKEEDIENIIYKKNNSLVKSLINDNYDVIILKNQNKFLKEYSKENKTFEQIQKKSFVIKTFFSKELCDKIISESSNCQCDLSNSNIFSTEKLSFFPDILLIFKDVISKKIIELYDLDINNFDIIDSYVLYYQINKVYTFEHVSINIILNNNFKENIFNLDIGDMVINSNTNTESIIEGERIDLFFSIKLN